VLFNCNLKKVPAACAAGKVIPVPDAQAVKGYGQAGHGVHFRSCLYQVRPYPALIWRGLPAADLAEGEFSVGFGYSSHITPPRSRIRPYAELIFVVKNMHNAVEMIGHHHLCP